MTKLSAGIIIIGDEILSGRTKDTNANFIAKKLLKSGIHLKEIRTIQDNKKIIINTIKEFKDLYTYVFTTGGIGPTHDDITSESVSRALNKKYTYNKEAYNILEKYYSKKNFNSGRKKMAKMPQTAELIYNPLTVAPGFKIENIYVLPGVPKIMKIMFSNLLKEIRKGAPKNVVTINTNLFESIMAKKLSIIQKKNPKCSIGSYPYFDFIKKKGGVKIVLSSWTVKNLDHIIKEVRDMISLLGGKSFIV